MSLKHKIDQEFIEALKNKDQLKLSALRMLKSALEKKSIEIGKDEELTDEIIGEIVAKEVKSRKESIAEYEKGDRQELAEKEKKEIEILNKYLPQQLSEEEIKKILEQTIKETDAKGIADLGKVMGQLMPKIKGKADGSLVSQIVKEKLTQ